jgi:DNA adenine methylase
MGRYQHPLICESNNLQNVSNALRYSKTSINFTGYSDHGFDDNDQIELSKIFAELNDRKCKVLLSNSDTPLSRKLYSDFSSHTKEVNVSRFINCKASKRLGHKELLISNYSS